MFREGIGVVVLVLLGAACNKPAPKAVTPPPGAHVVELSVTSKGFEPGRVSVKKGEPLALVVTRKTEQTCATDIVIDSPHIKQALPLDTPVLVTFTPTTSGELVYGCAMDKMIKGVLVVD